MATRCNDTVVTRQRFGHRIDDLIADLPRQKWKRRSCGAGAHGRRIYDWARVEVRPWHPSVPPASDPGPPQPHRPARDRLRPRRDHPRRPHRRRRHPLGHRIMFPERQGRMRPRPLPGRRHQGWYRHITLAMAAHAFLTVTRAGELTTGKERDQPGSSRSASPQLRRLITRLTRHAHHNIELVLHWSHWRHRRQHQARHSTTNDEAHSP